MRARALVAGLLAGWMLGTAPAAAQERALPFEHDWAQALSGAGNAWRRLLAAEDARAATPAQLDLLHRGTRARSPELRAVAVRALGRLERPAEAAAILPLLNDPAPLVRAYAANAAAQAVVRGDSGGVRTAARHTLASALLEYRSDSVAAPVMAESLGRIRHDSPADAQQTIARLLPLVHDPAVATGALRGLYFLSRQQGMRAAWDSTSLAALRAAYAAADPDAGEHAARRRALLVATLAAAGGADAAVLRAALRDVSPLVRREATLAGGALADTAAARDIVTRALNDGSGTVRLEGLRQYGRRFAAAHGCAPVLQATEDAHAHTALLALDLLATCSDTAAATAALERAAGVLAPGDGWHAPARALVALAALQPERARPLVADFAQHPSFFVRTYAARAAGRTRDEALLRTLAGDAHANVRVAAIDGLHTLLGRGADDVLVAQLARDESELLQAAARALDGTTHEAAPGALVRALDRVTARQEETSRDARRALLTRIGQVGSAAHAAQLEPYLRDFDPQVANHAADIIGRWTGTRPAPEPVAPPAQPLPTFDMAARLARSIVTLEMMDGSRIELRLLPFEAPTNAARFARLAAAGYYDGLTLHRIVPNFVVQGGSPGASEYTGDGPFTRDELGLAGNWRGTVGLSTRGRDTGDAQFYINTIDNVRLDHEYTIFAEVVSGMQHVDAMLEGAAIRRVVITR